MRSKRFLHLLNGANFVFLSRVVVASMNERSSLNRIFLTLFLGAPWSCGQREELLRRGTGFESRSDNRRIFSAGFSTDFDRGDDYIPLCVLDIEAECNLLHMSALSTRQQKLEKKTKFFF